MPLYEYRCDVCGSVFEVLQKFSDEPLTKHNGCGGQVQRLISPPGLQFKGTGWYITDYARSSKSESSSNGAAKAEEKTSKPDSASPAKPSSPPAASN